MDTEEGEQVQEASTEYKTYAPATKARCRLLYINGTHSPADISKETGVGEYTIKRWCWDEKWTEARELRLHDAAGDVEVQLKRLRELIAAETDAGALAKLWTAYEKAYGVYAWMRGLPRPGVSQTAKPTKSRYKPEAPE